MWLGVLLSRGQVFFSLHLGKREASKRGVGSGVRALDITSPRFWGRVSLGDFLMNVVDITRYV